MACAGMAIPPTNVPCTSEAFTANDDNLRFALKFEADRMVNSFIAKKDPIAR